MARHFGFCHGPPGYREQKPLCKRFLHGSEGEMGACRPPGSLEGRIRRRVVGQGGQLNRWQALPSAFDTGTRAQSVVVFAHAKSHP
jgi:hypothetical protein